MKSILDDQPESDCCGNEILFEHNGEGICAKCKEHCETMEYEDE